MFNILLSLLVFRLIPESPRWLLLRNQVEEAELVIRRAAKWNRVPAPEVIFRAGESSQLMVFLASLLSTL